MPSCGSPLNIISYTYLVGELIFTNSLKQHTIDGHKYNLYYTQISPQKYKNTQLKTLMFGNNKYSRRTNQHQSNSKA